jgi:very-short-patch-repair endonuclease
MIDYRLRSGDWTGMARSVYVIFPAPHWEQTLMGACLWGGAEAVVSHTAAGALWRLDGVPAGRLDVTLRRSRRSPFPGLNVRVTQTHTRRDVTTIGVLPVTSVVRTLIDLGSVVDATSVEEALDCALRRRMTTPARIRQRLDELGTRGHRGAAVLRQLLVERPTFGTPTESALEVRLARLLRSADLPAAEQQYEIVADGKVLARCDFAYPAARLAVEADGYAFHSGKQRWQYDLARRNEMARLGWRVIHVTDRDIRERPREIMRSIREALNGNQERFLS